MVVVVTLMTPQIYMSMTALFQGVHAGWSWIVCWRLPASSFLPVAQAETGGNSSRSTSGARHVTHSLTKQQKAVHAQSMTQCCLSAAGSTARVQRHQRVTGQQVSRDVLQGQQCWRYLLQQQQQGQQHCWLSRMLLLLLRLSRACRSGGCAHS